MKCVTRTVEDNRDFFIDVVHAPQTLMSDLILCMHSMHAAWLRLTYNNGNNEWVRCSNSTGTDDDGSEPKDEEDKQQRKSQVQYEAAKNKKLD